MKYIRNNSGEIIAVVFDLKELENDEAIFLTPNECGMQVAVVRRKRDYEVRPYYHVRYRPRGLGTELLCVVKEKILVTLMSPTVR